MSLSGKYISIYEIIERVYIDNGYENIDLQDAVVWAGAAMDRIGAIAAYESAPPVVIPVTHNRGKFPCDVHKITQMRHWPSLLPMVISKDNFAPPLNPETKLPEGTDDSFNDAYYIGSDTYVVAGDFFFPGFTEGEVQLSYTRFPTDENGFPKIPLETKYSDAVAAYIQMKLDFRAFRKKELSGEIYMISKRDWAFKAGQAKQKALAMDTVDQMESFKRQFLRLVPNINQHASGFARSTNQESRRNNPTGVNNNGIIGY